MKVSVWDTYAKSISGDVIHFDIIVPDTVNEPSDIFAFGAKYLHEINQEEKQLSAAECKFCHIEEPTEEMAQSIEEKGYYILEMDPIPFLLPTQASRRDKIMYLKGHHPDYRFRDFKGISEDEVDKMLLTAEK